MDVVTLALAKSYTNKFNSQVTDIAPTSDGTGLIFTVVGGQTFTISIGDWNALTDDEKNKISVIDNSGDGNKYLSNNGTYKELIYTDNNFTNEEKEKISTNTSNITLLDSQILQLSNYVEYFPNNVVGVHVDFQNMEFDRLAGAENLTMGADFNKFNMYGGRKRCLLTDNGVVIAYNDGTKYICNDTNKTIITLENGESGLLTTEVTVGGNVYPIGTQIQVMVEQPKFYYKVVPIKLDKQTDGIGYHLRSANYYVSDYEYNGFKIHPAFVSNGKENNFIYLSAYEGCTFDTSASAYKLNDAQDVDWTNDTLASICGAKPASGKTQYLTRPNINQICMNRGAGWYSDNIKATSANQMLMIIEMGMMNSQTAIGQGVVNVIDNPNTENNSIVTGGTSALGNGTGQATGTSGLVSVSYRGVENPWGNIWKFIHGVNIWGNGTLGGGVPYYATDFNFAESKRTDNYVSAGFSCANASSYISAIGYAPECDWMFIGSECLGNSSVPVGDYQWTTANLNGYRIALLGGRWAYGADAGAFCWYLYGGVGTRSRDVGSRLVYVPTNAV